MQYSFMLFIQISIPRLLVFIRDVLHLDSCLHSIHPPPEPTDVTFKAQILSSFPQSPYSHRAILCFHIILIITSIKLIKPSYFTIFIFILVLLYLFITIQFLVYICYFISFTHRLICVFFDLFLSVY